MQIVAGLRLPASDGLLLAEFGIRLARRRPGQQNSDIELEVGIRIPAAIAGIHVRDVILRRTHAMNAGSVHGATNGGDIGARCFAAFKCFFVGIASGALGRGECWEERGKQGQTK